MSYTVKLGTLDKRVNSTKRPTADAMQTWGEYSVVLKESTSYDRPTLLLNASFSTITAANYNYAYMFSRYYWITDIRSVRTNVVEIDLALDILATFQTNIRATKAFIEYGSNSFNAGAAAYRIADSRRPVSKNPSVYTASDAFISNDLDHNGAFILQCVSGSSGVACYAMSGPALRTMLSSLVSDIETDIDDITVLADPSDQAANSALTLELLGEAFKNSLVAESATSAIKSIHWIPLSVSSISGSSANVYLGRYDTGMSAKLISNNTIWQRAGSVSIPWPVSDWRRCNIQMSLYVPFFGTVPVPIDQCNGNGSIAYRLTLDVLAGDLSVRITSGSQTIYTGSTNISAPYAYGFASVSAAANLSGAIQSVGGVMQMATGAVDAGAGIAGAIFGLGGGGISSGVSSMLTGAQNTLSGYAQTVQPVITSAGSMGGIAALGQEGNIILTLLYYAPIADSDFESLYGHPVYKVDTPALGFCKTRGFSISLGNEASYSAYINAVMDGGVFIEE